jgi:2'-5' RNA ligase
MYIWVGIDVDSQLSEIKEKTMIAEKAIGFENSNFTLPLHVSLKISFNINEENVADVMRDIEAIYEKHGPFDIGVSGIELCENICWIMMKKSEELNALHDELNSVLLEKYSVPLHEYDTDYKFHTTLFMDGDLEKVRAGYISVGDCELPSTLLANRFVIGCSPTGALGSFKVVKVIERG